MKLRILFFIFFVVILITPNSQAIVILKVKNKRALIDLEGLRTKKGAYFEAIDAYGKKRGFVQIKRIGKRKALGIVKLGMINKKWSLEPTSKKKVLKGIIKRRRQARQDVLIQEENKKQLLLARKRKMERKKRAERIKERKRLAKQKRAFKRFLASYKEGDEGYIESFPEKDPYQSKDVLSYNTPPQGNIYSGASSNTSNLVNPVGSVQAISEIKGVHEKSKRMEFLLGISPRVEYNIVSANPPKNKPSYLMQGLGFGVFVHADLSVNSFLRVGGNLGFKKFSVSAEKCGSRSCFLKVDYAYSGADLKLNVLQLDSHKFWLGFETALMYPVAISNKSQIEKSSFSLFHGTMGLALGLDLAFGNIVIPFSLKGSLLMPPSTTTLTGNFGLQAGIAYKF